MRSRVLRLLALVAATALVTAGVQYALASSGGHRQAASIRSPKGVIGPPSQTISGGAVNKVKLVSQTSDGGFVQSPTTFTTVPGMTTTIKVPRHKHAIIDARFFAEAACSGGGAASNWCAARILIGGVTGKPNPFGGADFALDSTDAGNETGSSWEGHYMERWRGPLPHGTYRVKVQVMVTDPAVTFWLDEMGLVVQRIKA